VLDEIYFMKDNGYVSSCLIFGSTSSVRQAVLESASISMLWPSRSCPCNQIRLGREEKEKNKSTKDQKAKKKISNSH